MNIFRAGLALMAVNVMLIWGCSGSCLQQLEQRTPAGGLFPNACNWPDGGAPPRKAMPHNGMPHNGMPHNGMSPEALARANHVLQTVKTHRLRSEDLRELRVDATEAKLLEYVVSCALDADSPPVSVAGAKPGLPHLFHGELGLCGPRAKWGDWAEAAPKDEACLELVSACVMARVTGVDDRIPISLRGEPECLFPLERRVPIETRYRENEGSLEIASFHEGWSPRFVGRCSGGQVTLRLSGKGRLRVCKGIYGCNEPKAPESHYYVGFIKEQALGAGESMTFPCPDSGPKAKDTGSHYFSVMVAAADPSHAVGAAGRGEIDVVPSTCGGNFDYPASEEQVFTYREGGFYGDLFKPASFTDAGTLSAEQYSCYSDVWGDGLARLAGRACAGPISGRGLSGCPADRTDTLPPDAGESLCFVNPPRGCIDPSPCVPDAGGLHVCATAIPATTDYLGCPGDPHAATRQSSYVDCHGFPVGRPSNTWRYSTTVYLNDPCDGAPNGGACAMR